MAKMDQTIAAAKSCAVECTNVEKKLKQLLDMTQDEALFHARQSAYLYRLGVQTLPKSLHCLSMRLTVDYFNSSADIEHSGAEKLENPALRHYIIFSTNLLASSMTVNSTVINSEVYYCILCCTIILLKICIVSLTHNFAGIGKYGFPSCH